ncbi:hypothetical protein ABK249_29105 [Neorhizobium sp. Rsf11]|uniref:Uncharacterized protein n=2 Tax=Neorhizobium TaxID=1525371 RepID=A0ABV0MBA4_9HYPH|nr:hypothetical protein [Neorhizobium petrolearium]MCC2611096.1 hypothetical protein [Neorhizobium petrolearium]WGI66312.1 hypothetical protein QEO92_14755 [Neorhizobium petrolearium]
MRAIVVVMLFAAPAQGALSAELAAAEPQCSSLSQGELEQRIKSYTARPSLSRILAADSLEILLQRASYSDAAALWSVPFYLVNDGKRVKRFFALLDCDGGVELSRDQWFKPK